MRKSIKKITAAISATILGALPMAGAFTANAARSVSKDIITIKYGDLDDNGKITDDDARKLVRLLSEDKTVKFTDDQLRRADVNGDGNRDSTDVTIISKFANDYTKNKKDIYGDADGNGEVDIYDAIMIQEYVSSNQHKGEINLIAADVNADGVVNSFDFELINAFRVSNKLSTLLINWGDVNSDGRITIDDYRKIKNLAAENTSVQFTSAELRRADINLDGYVDNTDADWLMHYISYNHFDWLS